MGCLADAAEKIFPYSAKAGITDAPETCFYEVHRYVTKAPTH